ncbi:putative transporter [Trachipleistophora hominis]|uniref:Putative transporter n=1 Tax=Trachipleistophora hominis TaxID=72359 RepID=L7JSX8_TRAHO|nr:putative transporter [Trachipleistophora hominis]
MKIVDRILKHREKIIKNMSRIKAITLLLATVALFFIIPYENTVYNKDSGYDYITNLNHVYFDEKTYDEFVKIEDHFVFELQPSKSLCETIIVYGRKKDLYFFVRLASSIKKMFCQRKNVKIILSDDYFEMATPSYFCEIDLCFGDETRVINNFMRHLSPNSDFFFITSYFFTPESSFNFRDVLFNEFSYRNVNKVYITIEKDLNSTKQFLTYLRALFNIDSHLFGTYYYFTFGNRYWRMENFGPFVFFTALYFFVDVFYGTYQRRPPWILLYFVSPLFCILFFREDTINFAIDIVFFFIINFKVGVFFALIAYLKAVKEMIYTKRVK